MNSVRPFSPRRWLKTILAIPRFRQALTWLGWLAFAGWLIFAAMILVLRHVILPGIGDHQAKIERLVSDSLGQEVRIGHLEAHWEGLNPGLTLNDVTLLDKEGRPAFSLTRVDSALSWHSLWRLRPILALLAVDGPVLHIRRDTAGKITIAGVDAEGESDPRIAEWVLEQPHIRIRNAIILWEDALRKAPPLVLEDLQFALDNRGNRHRFGLSAAPPEKMAARIDLRGDLRGNLGDSFEELTGKVFLELAYADLAGWRPWLDYPIDLPQGRGALRAWADWKYGQVHLTTDVALEDLRLRLRRNLPELDVTYLRGRLDGRYGSHVWSMAGHNIELQTMSGMRVTPTTFAAEWREDPSGKFQGSAQANLLDLDSLKRLAAHLPLDERSRQLLVSHDPRGRISDLRTTWEGQGEQLQRFALKAQFADLGLKADGYFPGAEGISGQVDFSEKGGNLILDSKQASLDLPAVFPEPRLPLSSLKAKASWIINGEVLDAKLERLDFAGPHASGSARGTYRFSGDGPGIIDLTAAIPQADGTAVWRYMPHAVNVDTRRWLERSIVAGKGSDAKLVLKGDLRDFPFRDKGKGEFVITAKAQGARLEYAPGWPAIEDIDATMTFGVGMHIEASKGKILGTKVGPVLVDIPDFEASEEMLLIRGEVDGPTGEFLKFIDQSPVGDKIDRFTEGMRASGHGHLALELDMPLRHVDNTKVRGDFAFQNNQITPIPWLPPVNQVNGRLLITENTINASEISGQALGGPLKLSVKSEADRVQVTMQGQAHAKEARKHLALPVLDNLTGNTPWRGEIKVRKRHVDFLIESTLAGISSSLPEPFNKTAGSSLPLRLTKSNLAASGKSQPPRDQIHITLGKVGEALIQRRQKDEDMAIEYGAVAIGQPLPTLPEHGIAAFIQIPKLDIDYWKRQFPDTNGPPSAPPLPITRLSLKTPTLRAFSRDIHDVDVDARPKGDGWQAAVSTRELAGEFFWRDAGEGWLEARLKRLAVDTSNSSMVGNEDNPLDSLPGLDIRVDDFSLNDKRLGKLEIKARNDKGRWHLDNLHLQNPDGSLQGKGEWERSGNQQTRLGFDITANDLGKLLDRLGYPGSVRSGTGSLKGELAWAGPLTGLHYPSLSGNLTVAANKGQFNKLEPGFGKLLGLLSLQSLPRRLTLDFRDIFSEGLAFDSIDGRLSVKNGILRIQDELKIDGPSTRILMKGETDLKQETQNILVTVQPEMGMVVSAGALLLAHPVIGAAAAVANKVLQNPLNKVFSFQYRVTGNWSDPKVDKIGQSINPEANERSPNGAPAEAGTP